MIGKVKKWLGIEGVKLDIVLPNSIQKDSGKLQGKLRFSSLQDQTIVAIRVVLIERYARGRKAEQLIDEYELGSVALQQTIEVPANGMVEVPFELPFSITDSEMDHYEKRNILTGGLVKLLKYVEGVNSEFRIEAEAKVAGVALSPFDKKQVIFD